MDVCGLSNIVLLCFNFKQDIEKFRVLSSENFLENVANADQRLYYGQGRYQIILWERHLCVICFMKKTLNMLSLSKQNYKTLNYQEHQKSCHVY